MKALLYLITIAAFSAQAYCESSIHGLKDAEKQIIEKTDTKESALESAKLAYKKFGYVAPITALAKNDENAAKELNVLMKSLAGKAGAGDKYAGMQLAEIYYSLGDFQNFEKYASADISSNIKDLARFYNVILDDLEISGSAFKDDLNFFSFLNSAFYNALNDGNTAAAKKIIDIIKNKYSANDWSLRDMYLRYYGKTKDKAVRDEILSFEDRNLSGMNIDPDVLRYCLMLDDPSMKENADALLAKIEKLPENKRYRDMYKAYEQMDRYEDAGKMLEKVYETGELNSNEKMNLAYFYLGGRINYWDGNVNHIKGNPKKELIIKLLEESYDTSEYNKEYIASSILNVYVALDDKEGMAKWAQKVNDSDNYWALKDMAIKYYFGDNGFGKDENKALELIEGLNNEEAKGDFYASVGSRLLSKSPQMNIKLAKEFLEKAMCCGSEWGANILITNSTFQEIQSLSAKYPDNNNIAFNEAMRVAKAGKWDVAFKAFENLNERGYKKALPALYACYALGLGTQADAAKAQNILNEIALGMSKYGSRGDNNFSFYDCSNILKYFVKEDSDVYQTFLAAAENNLGFKETSRTTMLNGLISAPIENKEAKVQGLITEISEIGKSDDINLRLFNIYSNNSNGYADYEKAAEYAKKLYGGDRYSKLSYVFMVLRGIGVPKDEEKAFRLLTDWKTYSNNEKNIWLAYFYENGIGTDKDESKAAEYRGKVPEKYYWQGVFNQTFAPQAPDEVLYYANKNGNDFTLADIYMHGGYGVQADQAKALELLTGVYEKNPEFAYEMAVAFKSSKMLKDAEKYLEYLKKYESLDYPDEMERMNDVLFWLGCAYLNGWGTDANPTTALEYFKRVAADGESNNAFKAREAVAYATEMGLGVEKNPELAAKMREEIKAEMLADMSGLKMSNANNIASSYNPEADFEFAPNALKYAEWLEFAVKNNPKRDNVGELSDFYSRNIKHRDWQKSAEYADLYHKYWANTPWDLYKQGILNVFGIGREKNAAEGVKQLEKAAAMFYPYAAETLSYIYSKGIGVEQNSELAEKWLETFKTLYGVPYVDIAASYICGANGAEDSDRAEFILQLGADSGSEQAKKNLESFDEFSATLSGTVL